MGQEAEFKLRWCMHSLPPHCWKNFGGTLPLLLSTDKNYATKPCTYYFVYHNSEILFNRENFQSPPKSFNTLLPAFYLQQFTSLRSCWRKALMLATQKEWYPWDRFVGQRVGQEKLKLLEKKPRWLHFMLWWTGYPQSQRGKAFTIQTLSPFSAVM